MSQPSFSLSHFVQEPRAQERPAPLLVLLHGYGSNEQDLIGLAPYLDPRFLIVSARAPHMIMPGGYGWFELGFTPGGLTVNLAQAEASRTRIIRFIREAMAAYGADTQRIFLMGFSQGAMMSASVVLAEPGLVAGAVLMSGWVLPEMVPAGAPSPALHGKPILMVHGTMDTVVPITYGREGRDLLEQLPVALTYREYPMGHEVSLESLRDVAAWLTRQLGARG